MIDVQVGDIWEAKSGQGGITVTKVKGGLVYSETEEGAIYIIGNGAIRKYYTLKSRVTPNTLAAITLPPEVELAVANAAKYAGVDLDIARLGAVAAVQALEDLNRPQNGQ